MSLRDIILNEKKNLCKSRFYLNYIMLLWVIIIIISAIPVVILCDYNYDKYKFILYAWFIFVGIGIIAGLIASKFVVKNEIKITLGDSVKSDIFLLDKTLRESQSAPFPYNYSNHLLNINYLTRRIN